MPLERLDKVVSSVCEISRKDARSVIKCGEVVVDGVTVKDAAVRIDTETVKLTVSGEDKTYKQFVYIMLNKPQGILSASNDRSRKTVVDLVKADFDRPGLFPVGRLDKDTTGLLIVTDDGDFGHKVISPKSFIEKEYIVLCDKPITDRDVKVLEQGVTLADGTPCRPAKVLVLSEDRMTVSIVITEGKYHEIKRMLGVVGAGVCQLHRKRIGGLTLDPTLNLGCYRELSASDLCNLWK